MRRPEPGLRQLLCSSLAPCEVWGKYVTSVGWHQLKGSWGNGHWGPKSEAGQGWGEKYTLCLLFVFYF